MLVPNTNILTYLLLLFRPIARCADLETNLHPVDEPPACRTVSAAQVLLARFCACHDSLTNAQPAGPRASPHHSAPPGRDARASRYPCHSRVLRAACAAFCTPRPAMTHVQRLWLLCLAYASATATPTFGNAQTIVSDMARKAQLLGVLLRLGGAWAFPSRTGVNNHQNWGQPTSPCGHPVDGRLHRLLGA